MNQTLRTLGTCIVVIAALALVAGLFPQIGELHRAMEEHRRILILITAGGSGIGLALLMGAVLSLIMDHGTRMNHREVEDQMRSQRDAVAWPYVFRASTYRVRGQAAGAAGHDQFTFAELKAAFRSGAILRDHHWQRRLVAVVGGLLMLSGIFGLAFVLAPPTVKVIVGGAAVYALVRMTWSLVRA